MNIFLKKQYNCCDAFFVFVELILRIVPNNAHIFPYIFLYIFLFPYWTIVFTVASNQIFTTNL